MVLFCRLGYSQMNKINSSNFVTEENTMFIKNEKKKAVISGDRLIQARQESNCFDFSGSLSIVITQSILVIVCQKC